MKKEAKLRQKPTVSKLAKNVFEKTPAWTTKQQGKQGMWKIHNPNVRSR